MIARIVKFTVLVLTIASHAPGASAPEVQEQSESHIKFEFNVLGWTDADIETDGRSSVFRFTLRRFVQYLDSSEFGRKMYHASGYVITATESDKSGAIPKVIWLVREPVVHITFSHPINFDLGDVVWDPESKTLILATGFSSAKQAYFTIQRVQIEFDEEGVMATDYANTLAALTDRVAKSAHTKLSLRVLDRTDDIELDLLIDDVPVDFISAELPGPSRAPEGVSSMRRFNQAIATEIEVHLKESARGDLALTK
ncbi:MAG: hypothetical protein ACNA8P_12030 [Phycisphaerales bacterium]